MEKIEHGVSIIEGSHLNVIMGDETANSIITKRFLIPKPGNQCYSTHDNLIEGVERNDKRFCIGVQWHPERIGHIGLYRAWEGRGS